jgi:hypothetical protein
MKKIFLFATLALVISSSTFSQGVGIGTNNPDASAVLDITATNKGLLIPRMSLNVEAAKKNLPLIHPMIGEEVDLNGQMKFSRWWENIN